MLYGRRKVMASDGLWDVVSNEDVLSIIKDTVRAWNVLEEAGYRGC
ncbi:unnamed protein product [Urochloa humidicola]